MSLLELADKIEAVEAAIRHFAAEEQSFRNPNGDKARRLSKKVRQTQAAQYAQWQRDLSEIVFSIEGAAK